MAAKRAGDGVEDDSLGLFNRFRRQIFKLKRRAKVRQGLRHTFI